MARRTDAHAPMKLGDGPREHGGRLGDGLPRITRQQKQPVFTGRASIRGTVGDGGDGVTRDFLPDVKQAQFFLFFSKV